MSNEEVSREVYDEITKNVFQLVLNEDKEERNKFNEYINKYYLCKEVEITNEDWNEIKQIMPFIKDLLLQKENDQDLLNLFKTLIPPTIVETLEAAKAAKAAEENMKSNILKIITVSEEDITKMTDLEKVFREAFNRYCRAPKYAMPKNYIISPIDFLNSPNLTNENEIKIHLILSIILLHYVEPQKHEMIKKNIKKNIKEVITEKWDTVSKYVNTVITQDKTDPTARVYDKTYVDNDLKDKIKNSGFEGYFVFLFRYLRYAKEEKYKQYFSFDQSE